MKIFQESPVLCHNGDTIKSELDRLLSLFELEEGAVLIQIPQVSLDLLEQEVARNRGYFAYPPQGLLYISAIRRKLGVPARIIDLNFVILEELQKEKPDIAVSWRNALDKALLTFSNPFVCVSLMYDITYPYFREVCNHIRHIKPNVCIATGGVSAAANVDRILQERLADFVFSYEAEESLKRFYAYFRKETIELPLNLSFLDSGNSVLHTQTLFGGDVNVDIREEYSLIPIKEFHMAGSLGNYSRMRGVEVPFATILSRRGCRGHCSFCGVKGFYGKGVRVRHIQGIIQEMEHLYHKYGIRHFDWLDDDLLFDKESALEMFDQIALRLPDITWASNNGLVLISVTPEFMRAMERSGCIGFKVGLESGNESILHKVHKPLSLNRFFSFAEMAQDFPSMFVAVNFIMGLPFETFGQMFDSFKAALQAKLDWSNFYIYQPISNTELCAKKSRLNNSNELSVDTKQEASGLSLNPVRGGAFKNCEIKEGVFSGYDIIYFDRKAVPNNDQLKEIWFTLNFIVNFLQMPALFTKSEVRLKNGLCWIEALSAAYPDDPAMSCVLYYLKHRLSLNTRKVLEEIRSSALSKIKKSKYWQFRDRQFNFSAFLDGVIPEVDRRYLSS